jgi:hypothetical protein
MSQRTAKTPGQPTLADYMTLGVVQCLFVAGLVGAVRLAPSTDMRPTALLGPVVTLFALTALVWLLMVAVRNGAILRGAAHVRYYHAYSSDIPDERIERPARTFNNLMQVPTLFYVVCLLMLVTGVADRAQLLLGWVFAATRAVHAVIYVGLNRVPYRFAAYFAGCITLGVIWVRFAMATSAVGLW